MATDTQSSLIHREEKAALNVKFDYEKYETTQLWPTWLCKNGYKHTI